MVKNSPKRVKNTVGKGEITRYGEFLLFPQFYKRRVLQTRKNKGTFGKGLTFLPNNKILDWSKLKALADDKINGVQKLKLVDGA